MSATTLAVVTAVGLTLLTALVSAAMHAAGGWRGLTSGTAVYTVVVLAMGATALLVLLVVHFATG